MNIAFVASEAVPFCKSGGLADVTGALTEQLAKRHHNVLLVLPFYQTVHRLPLEYSTSFELSIPMGNRLEQASVLVHKSSNGVRVCFIKADRYFNRPGLYGDTPGSSYSDNHIRFAILCRGALEVFRILQFRPDIVHGHDWQVGLLPAYLKTVLMSDRYFSHTRTLFSIHNMAYQGNFSAQVLPYLGLPTSSYHPHGLEFYGEVNFLKAGLFYSDGLSTVSHTYAHEIMSQSEYGRGFEGLLYTRRQHFRGILNGLDTNFWDPKNDPLIKNSYSVTTLEKRLACKKQLQSLMKFPEDSKIPVLGFVGRLDVQKGIDILVETAPGFMDLGCQMIFLGVGDPGYRSALEDLRRRFPRQVYLENGFAEPVAHKIYAGSDIFLMPSRYEPCGLGQMIAMRYGAIPVVTPTGGLVDTVDPIDEHFNGTGFVAAQKNSHFFYLAVKEALSVFQHRSKWIKIQRQSMGKDFSWTSSTTAYLKLYKDVLHWHRERSV